MLKQRLTLIQKLQKQQIEKAVKLEVSKVYFNYLNTDEDCLYIETLSDKDFGKDYRDANIYNQYEIESGETLTAWAIVLER